MKRILALIFALLMCLSFTACKDKESSQTEIENKPSLNTSEVEHEIRVLMEKNLDCYYLFYVAPLTTTAQRNSDGYCGTDESFLREYSELESLVNSTYINETASKLLNHPDPASPLYKNVDGKIFEKADVITPVEYNIIWDDTYTVEFLETSDTKCTFKLTTTDFDSNVYTTDGAIVYVDEKWLFEDLIY